MGVTTFPFHVVTHARMHRPAMPMHADLPRSHIPIWHITFTIIRPHTHTHLLRVPQHLHSFVHFPMYSDLIPTSSHDHWLMPTHLKTPTKSSSGLWLMLNRLVHSRVYSSHLDLAAHNLQLMLDCLKTLSHSSLVSYLFIFDSYLFISRSDSQLVPIHL